VGMGGAAFPAHIKLESGKKIDTLIINGAECEPYVTCDHRLLLEQKEAIVGGMLLLKKAAGADRVVLGIESNKTDAYELYRSVHGIECVLLKTKYPQGGEKQIIYAVTGRKIPVGKLPSEAGCLVFNVQTAYATYLAAFTGKKRYERLMTVSGSLVKKPGNYIIKTGTPCFEVINFCGIKEDPAKVMWGGPMMGVPVYDMNISVQKSTSAILFLTKDEINNSDPMPCINCTRCYRSCPMYLMPMFIDSNALTGDYASAKKYGAMNCIECGCCAYVCPAKRPLVQSIRLAKKNIRDKKI